MVSAFTPGSVVFSSAVICSSTSIAWILVAGTLVSRVRVIRPQPEPKSRIRFSEPKPPLPCLAANWSDTVTKVSASA